MILTLKETGVPKCVLSGPPQLVSLKAEPSILTSTGISSFAHQPSALQRKLNSSGNTLRFKLKITRVQALLILTGLRSQSLLDPP